MNRRATAIFATRKRTFRKHANSSATSRQLRLMRACGEHSSGIAPRKKKLKPLLQPLPRPHPPRLQQNPEQDRTAPGALISDVADSEAPASYGREVFP